jgi:hypothetical protein
MRFPAMSCFPAICAVLCGCTLKGGVKTDDTASGREDSPVDTAGDSDSDSDSDTDADSDSDTDADGDTDTDSDSGDTGDPEACSVVLPPDTSTLTTSTFVSGMDFSALICPGVTLDGSWSAASIYIAEGASVIGAGNGSSYWVLHGGALGGAGNDNHVWAERADDVHLGGTGNTVATCHEITLDTSALSRSCPGM